MIPYIDFYNHPEFLKLKDIGGHKVYHLEGNAYEHSLAVMENMFQLYLEPGYISNADFMMNVAILHDIGKIYTSICHGENDWEYPDHAQCGSFRGILCKFIPEDDPDFKSYQWFIRNHIKPLFWKGKDLNAEFAKVMRDAPSDKCTIKNLVALAICDVLGSKSAVPQDELIAFLTEIIGQ